MKRDAERAIEAFARGGAVIVADDDDREGEGDFIVAADAIDASAVNLMVTRGRGLLCCAIDADTAARFELAPRTSGPHDTAYADSVDARRGVTTGISCEDRARTIAVFADPEAGPGDFDRPGHVPALVARRGGTLERRGHTEAAVELCALAGRRPAAALCEILSDDGTMARGRELAAFAESLGLPFLTVDAISRARKRALPAIRPSASARVPTPWGEFDLTTFSSLPGAQPTLALSLGIAVPSGGTTFPETDPALNRLPVRIHSECATGDLFGSLRCDCGSQLREAMRRIGVAGRGAVIYLRQEGRGIGLEAKLAAYGLQDLGRDTVDANLELGYPADAREYWEAVQVLRWFGARSVELMTNNPAKVAGLEEGGIEVAARIPIAVGAHSRNQGYLATKRARFGHAP